MRTPTSLRSGFRRLRPAAAAVVVAAVALAACGGGGGSGSGAGKAGAGDTSRATSLARLVADAGTRTAAVGSARLSMDVEVSGSESGTVRVDGVVDLAQQAASLDLTLSGAGLSPTGSDVKMSMRLVDGVVYVDASALGLAGALPGVPAGATWLKLDLKALGDLGGSGGAAGAAGVLGGDPTEILKALQGVGDVTELGKEQVRGVETTHYRVDVDLAGAVAQLPEAERDQARSSLEALGIGTLPLDLWIDGDGLLRRLVTTADVAATGTTPAGKVKVTVELYDFGAPVQVEAPPADQTADLGGLLSGMLSGGSAGALGGASSSLLVR